MFIESHVSIEFDEKGLAGFRMKWILDEMSGASFIMDYDTNQDGQFSPRETAILKKEAFDNLKEYNYMSHVAIDGRAFEVEWVKDFSASIEDNKLVYHFFIPCHVTAIEQNKRIQMAVYDDTFFIDFAIKKEHVSFHNSDDYHHVFQLKKNLNKSYYFDQLHPLEIVLVFKKK